MNKHRSLVERWQKTSDQKAIIELYKENFPIVKNLIFKSFFFKQYESLVDEDDVIQLLDISFLESLKTYDINASYKFITHFFNIAKYKVLDTYRKYSYNNHKIFKSIINQNFINEYTIEKKHFYDFDLIVEKQEIRNEKIKQKKFLNWFYKQMDDKDINKKILYYKLKNYSSKEISRIINLNVRHVIYRWNNLKTRIKKNYMKWKNMQNN